MIGVIFVIALNALMFVGTERLLYASDKKTMDQRSEYIISQNNILANRIRDEGLEDFSMGENDGGEDIDVNNLVETMACEIEGRIIVLSSNFQVVADTYRQKVGKYIVTQDVIGAMSGKDVDPKVIDQDYVQVMTPFYNKDTSECDGLIVTFGSLKSKDQSTAFLREQRGSIMGMVFLLSIAVAIIFVLFMSRFFRDIKKEMNYIASGHQEERLSEEGFREFYQIAVAFNKITDRYKELENSRKEFVSNVSHELKTPITSMKVLADSLIMMDNVPVEIYEEFMNDIVHEIDRENQIITDLLDLVRMDKASNDLNIAPTNVNELLEVLLKRITPIAKERNITIHLETMRQVMAEVDSVKLSLACNNLIENAVKYNNDGGKVNVYLNADHKFFYVRVKDNGVGIPEDCQDKIFERFYRVDKARSRDTGGTGLGLAITRNVVLLHKGSIRVHSKPGEETTFIIRIPLNYVG